MNANIDSIESDYLDINIKNGPKEIDQKLEKSR